MAPITRKQSADNRQAPVAPKIRKRSEEARLRRATNGTLDLIRRRAHKLHESGVKIAVIASYEGRLLTYMGFPNLPLKLESIPNASIVACDQWNAENFVEFSNPTRSLEKGADPEFTVSSHNPLTPATSDGVAKRSQMSSEQMGQLLQLLAMALNGRNN
jgi:hypothetical protein